MNIGVDFTVSICFLVFMGFMIFADVDAQRKCRKKKRNEGRKLVVLTSVIRCLCL